MPRTPLNKKDHAKLVAACGGVLTHSATIQAIIEFPTALCGNLGIALKVGAIQAFYA